MSVRIKGVYGGTNINTQKLDVIGGMDVLVATPGRLYDLALANAVSLKHTKKVVIDEVDVMLDLGFRFQLTNIFDFLPEKRQNIMFSATMTNDIESFIKDYFFEPVKVSIAMSGTPLENIEQSTYTVPNFYTKINLLKYLVKEKAEFTKVLVFTSSKKKADLIFKHLEYELGQEMGIIHANKSQNYRIRSIKQFDSGEIRILITTDVMARGLDLDTISHVINFNTPDFPENYMHRIGRSGRAERQGCSILFAADYEQEYKSAIEELMGMQIPEVAFPEEVEIATLLLPEERPILANEKDPNRNARKRLSGDAFHEKKDKNKNRKTRP
jgi:ATP-dependent RNA helicase RhlE